MAERFDLAEAIHLYFTPCTCVLPCLFMREFSLTLHRRIGVGRTYLNNLYIALDQNVEDSVDG